MRKWILLTLLLLAGCSQPPESCLHYVECSEGQAACMQDAKETCPAGYTNVNESDVGGDFHQFIAQHFPAAAAGTPYMMIQCKD